MNRGQRKYDKKKKMNGKARSCADTLQLICSCVHFSSVSAFHSIGFLPELTETFLQKKYFALLTLEQINVYNFIHSYMILLKRKSYSLEQSLLSTLGASISLILIKYQYEQFNQHTSVNYRLVNFAFLFFYSDRKYIFH